MHPAHNQPNPAAPQAAGLSHQPLAREHLPRGPGVLLGLVTAVDFWAQISVLLTAETIRNGLGAAPASFLWVLTIYAGAGIATLPLIERASRRWHYRQLIAGGIGLYLLGALLAASSQTLWQLVLARLVQGIGGGGLFTMSRVYLQLVTPQTERPAQLRGYIFGLMTAVAPLPWLAALSVQHWNWRAGFVLQAAFALPVLLLVLTRLRTEQHTPRSLGALDWPMSLSFALGMMLLLHGLEGLELARWSAHASVLIALALVSLTFAAWRTQRHPDPLLRLHVLNGRRYLAGLAFYALYYLINGAASYLYPRLFSEVLDLDLQTTGALQSFAGTVTVLALPVYFRHAAKLGDRRRLIALGFACAACCLLWLSWALTHAASWPALLGPMALKGIFPILGVIQIAGLTYTEVAHEDFAHAYALKNIVRLIANVFAAGLASQYWHMMSTWHAVSGAGGNPVVLTGQNLLAMLAALCVLGMLLVRLQKRLR
ncbi:MAG: MFS transporter [Rhodoferax sp.]|nr:MFS transporter [Rhodoferax sp.]